jgi:hypothetical protein
MKIKVVTQAQKQHDTNRLHDAFIAANLIPLFVESIETESRFSFNDAVSDSAINSVISTYVFSAPTASVDVKAAWTAYKTALNNASTVPQLKSALTNELGVLLKEILKTQASGLS